MNKLLSILLVFTMLFTSSASIVCCAQGEENEGVLSLIIQVGNPVMTVNGSETEIDAGRGTSPIIKNDRTLVPVRAIIEAMGGTVLWDEQTQTVTLDYNNNEIQLIISSMTAILNGEAEQLDVAPEVINEITMLPIRFIAESFGFQVNWEEESQSIAISAVQNVGVSEEPILPEQTADKDKNVLIAYFSRAGENWQVGYVEKGNTAVIAEYIESMVDADVFEIQAVDSYPESYDETLTRVNRERDNNERPQFVGEIQNIDQYDIVFLGYPIWYGGLPMILYTFLEKYDMSGKTIIPFSTHGGSGWGSTLSELGELCPDAELIEGFSTAGTNARSAQADVEEWLEGLALPLIQEGLIH
ncbi:MAG: flavodoxin [Monoglobales bacterium]